MRALGTPLLDLSSGVAVSRFGDEGAMITGSVLAAKGAVGASLSRSVVVLAGPMLATPGATAIAARAVVAVAHRKAADVSAPGLCDKGESGHWKMRVSLV